MSTTPVAGASRRRVRALVLGAVGLALALGAVGTWRLRRSVELALQAPAGARRPLQFTALPELRELPVRWGTDDVTGVALTPAGLLTAGGSGLLVDGRASVQDALPSLRVAALCTWRGRPVAALQSGGVFRRAERQWEEARSGWGDLNVRALLEAPGGELLIGAREGLYRAAWGDTQLARLDAHPVRTLAVGPGFVLAGGEQGLYRIAAGRSEVVATPDPWIERVTVEGEQVWLVTAAGLAHGPASGPFAPVPGGEDVIDGVGFEGSFLGLSETPARTLLRAARDGRVTEQPLPAPARRLLASEGVLFADTLDGLYRRDRDRWVLARPRASALPGDKAHVGALARLGTRVAAGLFDGGLAVRDSLSQQPEWRGVPGSEAWGVNALLPAGGALYVASLRGAARYDGRQLEALPGPGAAFALAPTDNGVAIGYGQGVQVPGVGLLSAFHGLPGNQALALASTRPALFVGTPSGLGSIEGRRVRWQVAQGEGRLPHSWVTALATSGDALYVGTYGGGIVRRVAPGLDPNEARSGRFEPFVETEGLKINTQCLVEAGGRLYAGTDGRGLYRLSLDRRRFEPWRVPLPSPHVTALLADPDGLYVGTAEGLTLLPLDQPEKHDP